KDEGITTLRPWRWPWLDWRWWLGSALRASRLDPMVALQYEWVASFAGLCPSSDSRWTCNHLWEAEGPTPYQPKNPKCSLPIQPRNWYSSTNLIDMRRSLVGGDQ